MAVITLGGFKFKGQTKIDELLTAKLKMITDSTATYSSST